MSEFVERADAAWRLGREFQYVIRRRSAGTVVGGCGLHARQGPGVLEIGYWTHVDHLGAGVATTAAGALTQAALALAPVSRVEIQCDATNVRSAAVPRRIGYRYVQTVALEPGPAGEVRPHMVWAFDRD